MNEAEAALRTERDFAEGLLDTAPVIVLVLDTKGRIVRYNPYLERISGRRFEEVEGADWFETFVPEELRRERWETFSRALQGEWAGELVRPIVTKDGQIREIEWCHTELTAPGESFAAFWG